MKRRCLFMFNDNFTNLRADTQNNHQEQEVFEKQAALDSSSNAVQESTKKTSSKKHKNLQDVIAKIKTLKSIPTKERTDLQKAELKELIGRRKELEGRKIRLESQKEKDLAKYKALVKIMKSNNLNSHNELKDIIKYAKDHGYQQV